MTKVCSNPDCGRILIQGGIHMGVPFARHEGKLYCAKCYDTVALKRPAD